MVHPPHAFGRYLSQPRNCPHCDKPGFLHRPVGVSRSRSARSSFMLIWRPHMLQAIRKEARAVFFFMESGTGRGGKSSRGAGSSGRRRCSSSHHAADLPDRQMAAILSTISGLWGPIRAGRSWSARNDLISSTTARCAEVNRSAAADKNHHQASAIGSKASDRFPPWIKRRS